MKIRRPGRWMMLWPGFFLTAAFFVPLLAIMHRTLQSPAGGMSLMDSYRGVFLFTVKQAALSTVFSLLLGLPGAYFIGRCSFPGRRLLLSISTVPVLLPPILAVLGFILVFGRTGLVNTLRSLLFDAPPWKMLYSLPAIVAAHVFYNFPLTLRIVGDAWSHLPEKLKQTSRSLGAGSLRAFITADIPLLTPALLTAALLTFIYCYMSFSVVLVLGGGPMNTTIEVEIYRLIKQLDFEAAAAPALVESLILFTLLGFYGAATTVLMRRNAHNLYGLAPRPPKPLRGMGLLLALVYLLPTLLLIAAPPAAVIVRSFFSRPTRGAGLHPSLIHWMRLFGGGRTGAGAPLAALLRTVLLSLAVAFAATTTAALSAWSSLRQKRFARITEIAMAAPLGVSPIVLGLGYLFAASFLPGGRFFRIVFLAAAHTVMILPFAHRVIANRFGEIPSRMIQAAQACGAGPFESFRSIDLPLARRALISTAVFSLAFSAGELNSAIILAPEGFTTIPLAIYRLIGSYDLSGACVLGSILIIFSFLAFLVLDTPVDPWRPRH